METKEKSTNDVRNASSTLRHRGYVNLVGSRLLYGCGKYRFANDKQINRSATSKRLGEIIQTIPNVCSKTGEISIIARLRMRKEAGHE